MSGFLEELQKKSNSRSPRSAVNSKDSQAVKEATGLDSIRESDKEYSEQSDPTDRSKSHEIGSYKKSSGVELQDFMSGRKP